ncbi:MAG TPA: ABC transporter substrate-binding protein [Thermomicrobiales bacterium]|nr:ABC transporter substrate-binding protein [Thermomicrobiales bacterium]
MKRTITTAATTPPVALLGRSLSRRWMLRGLAAAGLSTMAAGRVPIVGRARVVRQQPKPGGDLKWGLDREPDTLDPHVSSSRYDYQFEKHVFDTLVVRDAKGAVTPHLAEKWESNAAGTEWTFTLRQGVKFHDGTPFDAQAAKFSFDRIADPATKSEQAVFNLGPYDHTTVVNDHVITIVLKSPFAPLLTGLAEYTMGMVSPAAVKKYGKDFGRNPVGSGPFKFHEWVAKDHVTLVKNPDYNWAASIFDRNGPPYLDSVTGSFISESETAFAALQTGLVDLLQTIPDIHLAEVQGNPQFSVVTTTVQGFPPSMMFNLQKPPTDDPKVRQALMHAIDRNAIIQTVYNGSQRPAEGIWGASSPFFWPGGKDLYPLDPTKAGSLLDEAGWTTSNGARTKNGQPMSLTYLTLPGTIQGVAEFLQAQLQEMGIKVDILVEDNPAQQQDAQKGVHNIVWLNWLLADPYGLATVFGSENIGTGWNFSHYSNPKVDALFAEGIKTVDPAKRIDIYQQVQQLILGDAACFPINYYTRNWGLASKVQGFTVGPDGEWAHLYNVWLNQ